MGTRASRTVMLGDSMETDMAVGAALGMICTLVRSGVTSDAEVKRDHDAYDHTFADIREIAKDLLQK